jgi:GDPmannose 4,6-dehydratase
VREFIELVAEFLGLKIGREGDGVGEVSRVIDNPDQHRPKTGDIIIRIDPRYFRPTDVGMLLGDATKAKNILGWVSKVSFGDLFEEMI